MNNNNPTMKEWCTALRSGEYEQGVSYMKRQGKFCCLGVYADLHPDNEWIPDRSDEKWFRPQINGEFSSSTLPPEQQEFIGQYLHPQKHGYAQANILIGMNDLERKPFVQIADYIETQSRALGTWQT